MELGTNRARKKRRKEKKRKKKEEEKTRKTTTTDRRFKGEFLSHTLPAPLSSREELVPDEHSAEDELLIT